MTKPTFAVKPAVVALMALMAATRFHHFGTAFTLPDASLAVFFLGGLWLGGRYLFALLLLEAGLIDYLAISQLGVSDFCISDAYLFLIPAYAAMWLGGKYSHKLQTLSFLGAVQQFALLAMATSVAFLISNGSFFLLSGRYADLSWGRYVESFTAYYPAYLTSTLVYGVLIVAAVTLIKTVLAGKSGQQAFH